MNKYRQITYRKWLRKWLFCLSFHPVPPRFKRVER